jgi:hypothetical protein
MSITTSALGQDKKEANFDPTYVHTVFFWLKQPDNLQDREKFEHELSTFLRNSKYAQTNFIGLPPKATREVVDDSFTYKLVVTFASAQDQASYQVEPAHETFVENCKDLWQKVIVYDAEGKVY